MDKFVVENIVDSESNLTDDNLRNYVNVLGQLTTVGNFDIEKIRKYVIENNNSNINKKHILVAKHHNKIIGTGSIMVENKIIHSMSNVGHVEDIVVDVNYRSRGIANMIMNKLIEIGKDNNCYKLVLYATGNVSKFYEKIGFKINGNHMRMDIN